MGVHVAAHGGASFLRQGEGGLDSVGRLRLDNSTESGCTCVKNVVLQWYACALLMQADAYERTSRCQPYEVAQATLTLK